MAAAPSASASYGSIPDAPKSRSRSIPDTAAVDRGESSSSEQQATPHEIWVWNQHHWRHWHGIWVYWEPLESSRGVKKANRSVRSLRADNEERTRLYHNNQWLPADGKEEFKWEIHGPWILEEATHSLPNGILHPSRDYMRTLSFPNGDLAWLQLELKPDALFFGEMHFMLPEKNRRVPIILGYYKEGKLGAALMLEESRDTDEKPDPSWQGTLWDHKQALRDLDESRQEPAGIFAGKEMILSADLVLTQRQAQWTGFMGGLSKEDSQDYVLIHMPCNITAFTPKSIPIGREFAFGAHWVISDDEIRRISLTYTADGKLLCVKSGTYYRQSECKD